MLGPGCGITDVLPGELQASQARTAPLDYLSVITHPTIDELTRINASQLANAP